MGQKVIKIDHALLDGYAPGVLQIHIVEKVPHKNRLDQLQIHHLIRDGHPEELVGHRDRTQGRKRHSIYRVIREYLVAASQDTAQLGQAALDLDPHITFKDPDLAQSALAFFVIKGPAL